MDAKPHRPARLVAVQKPRDENLPVNSTSSSKQLDAKVVIPSYVTGSYKAATKRSALGDLSNTSHPVQQTASSSGTAKNAIPASKQASKMAPIKYSNKENEVAPVAKNGKAKPAFFYPPQRPKVGVRSNSSAQLPAQNEHRAQFVVKQPVVKPGNVYHDGYQQTLSRKYTSQPQLKAPEAPFVRRARSKAAMHGTPPRREGFGAGMGGVHYLEDGRTVTIELDEDDEIVEVNFEDVMDYMPRTRAEWEATAASSRDYFPELPTAPAARIPVSAIPAVDPSISAGMELMLQASLGDSASMHPVQPLPALGSGLASSPQQTHGDQEHWDEDESDDLDEEVGYTTAQSIKSGGDDTAGFTSLVAPRRSSKVLRELEEARLYVEEHWVSVDDHDDTWDMTMVAEYGEEIFAYMRELEVQMLPNPSYMEDIQAEMQWSMRSILMDWLVQVHARFTLLPETLFLAVNIIDRFLSAKLISLGKLQLVGATALLIAAKYEEIDCPAVHEISFMVDHGYTTDEILKAERFMLSLLGFELGYPGPMSFLRRISKADEYDLEIRTLAKYFLEVTIMDERFVGCTGSYLAAGAYGLAKAMLKKGDWNIVLVHFSGYTWAQLKPLMGLILECCVTARKHHLAVYDKYADRRFKKSSIYVQDELCRGFRLPFQYAIPRNSQTDFTVENTTQMRFPTGVLIAGQA